jgi:hypothetical protein
MIVKCAEADALRSSFPTMLGGMYIAEEVASTQGEIARPVFQEPEKAAKDNGVVETQTPAVPAEVVEPEKPKKKETPPDLRRKSPTARSAPTEATAHKKLADMLAVGNCTPQDFVKLALDEGWIEAEQGKFESIPEARVVEFLKPDNWDYIMQALDERAAKRQSTAVGRGELL